MRVGVVALQGGSAPHLAALSALGFEVIPIRTPDALAGCDGVVLPGGESTTQSRLMRSAGLAPVLCEHVGRGKPVLGTCAGLILLAGGFASGSADDPLDARRHLSVTVERNAWGPQVESFEAVSDDGRLPLVLIRAPRIRAVGDGVEVLARLGGEPVLVRQGAVVGATFHPELTSDRTVHRLAFSPGPGPRN